MSRTQDAATIRSNVGTLVGWATSNTAMRADLAKNAVTLIEAGLSGLLAYTPAASDGSLDVAWAAVEAALPADRRNLTWGLSRRVGGDDYYAWADDVGEPGHGGTFAIEATGPTPAAALRELAARLSESPSEGKTE